MTNKKDSESQIWQHNVWNTLIIVMEDVIISEKARKKMLSEGPMDTTALAKVARVLSSVDLAWRYR